jgi:hypothetical protein
VEPIFIIVLHAKGPVAEWNGNIDAPNTTKPPTEKKKARCETAPC